MLLFLRKLSEGIGRRHRGLQRVPGRLQPDPRPEDQALGEGVRTESVRSVHAHARGLPRRVQPFEARLSHGAGVDSAHHVVDDRPNGDGLVDRIDPHELLRKLPHERQLLVDGPLAQVANVQVHVLAVGPLECVALLDLLHDGSRQDVARPELHLPRDVVLQEPPALIVDEVSPLPAGGLRHEDAGPGEARRMVLDELHVLERDPGAIGERHAIPGADRAVRGEGEDPAQATRAQDDCLRGDASNFRIAKVDGS